VAPKPNAKPKKAPKPNKPKPKVIPKQAKLQEESEPIPVQDEKGRVGGFSLSRWTGDWFKQTAAHPTHLSDETNQSWRNMV
jgi:outer membrane biosynthesis protein TonB